MSKRKKEIEHNVIKESNIELLIKAKYDKEAKENAVKENMGLVRLVARRYKRPTQYGVSYEDILQIGTIGLLKAIDTFEPKRGNRFSTHAVWLIKKEINKEMPKMRTSLKVSYETIRGYDQKLKQGTSSQNMMLLQNALYLDTPVGENEDATLGDMIEDNSSKSFYNLIFRQEMQEQLKAEMLRRLIPVEYQVMVLRYGLEGEESHTLEETAQILGYKKRQNVDYYEKRALKKLASSELLKSLYFD